MTPHFPAVLLGLLVGAAFAPSSDAAPSPSPDVDDDTCLLQKTSVTQRHARFAPSVIEEDVAYLLQDPVAKIAVASPAGTEPSKMLRTVEAIVDRSRSGGGRVSPEDAELARSVARMLEDVSLPALEAGGLQNQRQVDRVGTSLATCEGMRTAAGTEAGGVADRRALLESARAAHRSCRALESELETERATKCGSFADYAAGLAPPAGEFPNPAGPSGPMEAFLRTNQEWFNEKYEGYMLHKERCESATKLHADKQQECIRDQTAFETSSCALSTSVHSMCAPYTSCRDAAGVEQVSTWQDVRAIEEQRKVEFVTLSKIKCLILSLAVEDEAARSEGVAACVPQDLSVRYDGSTFDPGQLNITYPVVAPRFFCSEDQSAPLRLPCAEEFLSREYAALPSNAHAAACVPCVGMPVGPDTGPPADTIDGIAVAGTATAVVE